MTSSIFTGLSAFPLTPLHDDKVDEEAFADLITRLVVAGVDSITVLGSTGSYAYLTPSERARIAELAVEHAGSTPVFVGVGDLRTSHVLAHVEVLGEHVDVLRRIDSRAHDAADGVVLGRLLMGPRSETRHRDVDGWFLGAPADLLRLETRLGERFEVDRAESAAGLDGLHVETVILDEAAEDEAVDGFGAAASPAEELTMSHLIDDVADALDDVGIIGPFEVIDVFPADDDPGGDDLGDGAADDSDDDTDPGDLLED